MKEIKYYTSSDGTKIPLNEVDFTHLLNGMAKKMREIFEEEDKEEFIKKQNEINDIFIELNNRTYDFASERWGV